MNFIRNIFLSLTITIACVTGLRADIGNMCIQDDLTYSFAIDDSVKQLSYRFRAPAAGLTAAKLHVYALSVTTSGDYTVGIQADTAGSPSGTYLISLTQNILTAGWNVFDITDYVLTAGNIYHIVIKRSTASGSVTFGFTNPLSYRHPKDQAIDNSFQSLTYTASTWGNQNKMPIFLAESPDSSHYGSPYCSMPAVVYSVYGTRMSGEQITNLASSRTVDKAAFYVSKYNSPPTDLSYMIYNETAKVTMTSGTLCTASSLTEGTYVWKEASFAEITLSPGITYRTLLYATGCDSSNYYTLMASDNMNNPSVGTIYDDMTFAGSDCVAISTIDGGITWTPRTYRDVVFNLISSLATTCTVSPKAAFDGEGIALYADAPGSNADYGNSMIIDSNGKIVVAGYLYNGANNDMAVWRLNPDSSRDTSFGVNGFTWNNGGAGGGGTAADQANGVMTDSSNNIWVAGQSYNSDATANIDMCVWKFLSDGKPDMSFSGNGILNDGGAAGGSMPDDIGYDITMDSSGNLVVTGSGSNGTNMDMVIWKFDQTGNFIGTFDTDGRYVYNGGSGDAGYSVAMDVFDNIYVAGFKQSADSIDMAVWKLDKNGVPDSAFGTSGVFTHDGAVGTSDSVDMARSVRVLADGRLLVGGFSNNSANGNDMVIWRLLPNGTPDTSFNNCGFVTFNGVSGGNDIAESVMLDNKGRILAAGSSVSGTSTRSAFWRYNFDGSPDLTFGSSNTNYIILTATAGDGDADYVYDAVIYNYDGTGDIIACGDGDSDTSATANYDMTLIRLNEPCGEPATATSTFTYTRTPTPAYTWTNTPTPTYTWTSSTTATFTPTITATTCLGPDLTFGVDNDGVRVFDSNYGYDQGFDLKIDQGGGIIVAGALTDSSGNTNAALWRYDSSGNPDDTFGGSVNYITHDGPGNGEDFFYNVTIDRNGRILATGEEDWMSGTGKNIDMIVCRYLADGTIDTTFNGGSLSFGRGFGHDGAYQSVADSLDRVVVAGYSGNSSGNTDMMICRYLDDGTLDTTFGGTGRIYYGGSGDDRAVSLVIDGADNVIVCGTVSNGSDTEMTLVKFMASDGGIGWARSYGQAGWDYEGNCIIMDNAGKLVVSGNINDGTSQDLAVWRCLADGTADNSFSGDGRAEAGSAYGTSVDTGCAVTIDRNDRIMACGITEVVPGDTMGMIARFFDDGTPDGSLSNGSIAYLAGLADGTGTADELISIITDDQNRILVTGGSGNAKGFTDPANRDMILARGIDGCSVYNTPTYTPTLKPSFTSTATVTLTVTQTATGTITATITQTVTATVTSTITATVTRTVTATATGTVMQTVTQTATGTVTQTVTQTVSETVTLTPTPTDTATITVTVTATVTPTLTRTSTGTHTETATPTHTLTWTLSETPTYTVTGTVTTTVTETVTETVTPTKTLTATDTATSTFTLTQTLTFTPTESETATDTPTFTMTPTVTDTPTGTWTFTDTPTFTVTWSQTQTYTYTHTYTATPTGTETSTVTETPSYTFTVTVTETHTITSTHTLTHTLTPGISQALDKNYVNVSLGETLFIKVNAAAAGAPVTIKVYNLAGEFVREITGTCGGAGWNSFEWNIKNSAGRAVGRGLYFIRIQCEGAVSLRKVYVVK
ncbi:MAG: hypothetical protein LLG37_00965 [Spirochaetia bacterium]|nr:hypothetical protein [Spirochaetia bacterium]